jgi:hypothetical protein
MVVKGKEGKGRGKVRDRQNGVAMNGIQSHRQSLTSGVNSCVNCLKLFKRGPRSMEGSLMFIKIARMACVAQALLTIW